MQRADESIYSQVSQQRNSDSLFDLAGSSVISTKAFPFLTKYKRDDSVSRSIDEVASARSGRFREPDKTTLPSRNFDIITFGRDSGKNEQQEQQKQQNNLFGMDSDEVEKRKKVAATLRELEEMIRLEERLAAAQRFNKQLEQQQHQEPSKDRRRQEFEGGDSSSRQRNERDDQQPATNRDIVLRLYTSDRDQLMSAPSSSYEEDSTSNLKTYYPQPQLAHHEEVQPEDRSYNLYPQNPGNSYERPPPPVPSSSYNKPKNNYEQSDEDHYQQQRQPAIIASNSPQGPVIHITLNQHLPLGDSDGDKDGMGNQQRDTGDMTPAPPATPTASDMPSGPSPAVAPPAAFPQFFPTFGQSQGFFQGVPQPIQQSPPAALPAPVPPPTQPVVVVVSPNKKGGYSHYDSDSSGAGVKVVNGQYHTGAQQSYKKSRNEEVKGRSLSYTIRIPGDQSDDSQESRSSSYSRRPRTVISRNNRGAGDIYTSGSKPQEIFLNIGSDGIVRPSGKRRNKRSSDPQERKLLKFLQVDVAARQSRKGDPERLNKDLIGRGSGEMSETLGDTYTNNRDITSTQKRMLPIGGNYNSKDYFFQMRHIADKSPRRENKHIYKKEGKYHVP
ncbi:unnamed protein product [Notodromas monacha]|uniref:Uncharacterized protein n=1 Tax=Notodromas monacha TaxID=399045 RepID=A0A7R9BEG9_9CRUS|nr:unnamed protein product [Notodromas monacha]CAG0912781.1 unnamed protein product [Notodromas monacha]